MPACWAAKVGMGWAIQALGASGRKISRSGPARSAYLETGNIILNNPSGMAQESSAFPGNCSQWHGAGRLSLAAQCRWSDSPGVLVDMQIPEPWLIQKPQEFLVIQSNVWEPQVQVLALPLRACDLLRLWASVLSDAKWRRHPPWGVAVRVKGLGRVVLNRYLLNEWMMHG